MQPLTKYNTLYLYLFHICLEDSTYNCFLQNCLLLGDTVSYIANILSKLLIQLHIQENVANGKATYIYANTDADRT